MVAWLKWRMQSGEGRVQVLVLGDAGRSPRMQYHCLSLLKEGYAVDLIGYGGWLIPLFFVQQTHKKFTFSSKSGLAHAPCAFRESLPCWSVHPTSITNWPPRIPPPR